MDGLSLLAADSGTIVETSLRHEMQHSGPDGVRSFFDSLARSGRFGAAYLVDHQGNVMFSTHREAVGTRFDQHDPDCQECHRLSTTARSNNAVVTVAGRRMFRSMLVVSSGESCRQCHTASDPAPFLLMTEIPTEPFEGAVSGKLRENLLLWAGTILAAMVLVNFSLNRFVVKRLHGIGQVVSRFGQGHHDLRLQIDSPDEIGQLAQLINEMGDNIESEEARNRRLSAEVRKRAAGQQILLKRLIDAQEEERKRVARDLHDELGQDLSGLAVTLDGVRRMWPDPPEPVQTQLQQIRSRVSEMTDRAYDWIFSLRPSELDDLGLVPALQAHASRVFKNKTIEFQLDARGLDRRLPEQVETTLFRTVQEALNNTIRHSRATRVEVTVAVRNGIFEGEVRDNGCGFNLDEVPTDGSEDRGLGILGMRERIALCGGELKISSQRDQGTRILILIPLENRHG